MGGCYDPHREESLILLLEKMHGREPVSELRLLPPHSGSQAAQPESAEVTVRIGTKLTENRKKAEGFSVRNLSKHLENHTGQA